MTTKTARLIILSTLIPAGACFTKNVICDTKTYHLDRTISGTTPHNEDLVPIEAEPTCVRPEGVQIELASFPSVMKATYSGAVEIDDQHELKRFEEMMDAIEAGNGSSMSQAHIDTYTDNIAAILSGVRASCIERLTSDWVNCTLLSAEVACDVFVTYPAEAEFMNLDLGEQYERPPSYNSDIQWKGGGGWCHDYYDWDSDSDTESSSSSSSTGGEDTGAGETHSLDSSSGDEAEGPPFGNLEELVHCNSAQTFCSYSPQLIDNVYGALGEIARDGANLRFIGVGERMGPGVILEGFDRGEASTELAGAAGLRNGDVIRSVNGVRLDSEDAVLSVITKLAEVREATLSYERHGRRREVRLEQR